MFAFIPSYRRRHFCVFLFSIFLGSAFQRLEAASGTTGAAFLNIPVGARPAALGGAYSALAADAYAPVWNPAGLGFVSQVEVAGQHLSYLESIHYEFLGVVLPQGFGVSAQYLGSGDIPGAALDGTSQGTYSSHYGAYTLAYGRKLNPKLSIGLAGKFLEAKLANVSAKAYAGDAGLLFKANDRLSLAAGVANVGSKLTFLHDESSLPLLGKFAVAVEPLKHVLLALEAAVPKGDSVSAHFGAEWNPIELLSLRAGYRTDTTKKLGGMSGFSVGAGLKVLRQEFSYAWLPHGDLGDTQYFSLVLRFGGSSEERNILKSAVAPRQSHQAHEESEDLTELLSINQPKQL